MVKWDNICHLGLNGSFETRPTSNIDIDLLGIIVKLLIDRTQFSLPLLTVEEFSKHLRWVFLERAIEVVKEGKLDEILWYSFSCVGFWKFRFLFFYMFRTTMDMNVWTLFYISKLLVHLMCLEPTSHYLHLTLLGKDAVRIWYGRLKSRGVYFFKSPHHSSVEYL